MPTRPTTPDPSGDNARPSAFGSLGAGLDLFQDWLKAAGSALPNMPGQSAHAGIGNWAMPTLDPQELDKRIQDLKTVQFWLEQNTRMVAMSIQGLEVQKMTLNTLKGMNVSMDSLRDALKARNAAADMASAAGAAPQPAPAPAPPPETQASAHGSDDLPARVSGTDEATAGSAELINPMRWWDTLTEQFTHLASQASQTAQTVGSSMSDLLAQTQQAANAAAAQHAPPATTGKTASGTTRSSPAARKTARPAARKTARASSSTSAPSQAKRAPKG